MKKMENNMPIGPSNILGNSGESIQNIQVSSNSRKRTVSIALVIVIVIVMALSGIAILHNQNNAISNSTSQLTTSITTSMANSSSLSNKSGISSFVATASLSLGSGYYPIKPQVANDTDCNYTGYVIWYIKNGYPSNSSTPVNYSKINQTAPFAWYVKVGTSDNMAAYKKILQNNGGYCSQISHALAKNSSFSSSNVSLSENSKGYILSFTNFSQTGLKITNTSYIGARPNITWVYTNAVYGNAIISIGAWGLGNNIKNNELLSLTNSIISQYKNFST